MALRSLKYRCWWNYPNWLFQKCYLRNANWW